ncbi:low-density lipoprotein receptor-like [Mytilus galloprovincialis]|uniref:low-density lipoprotein receptor-like n=1 Tax=Mytilus galloprovincialis TaxID=29158 RepID=UPI003F7C6314
MEFQFCSGFIILVCLIGQGLQNNIIFTTYGTVKEINLNTGNVSDLLTNLWAYIHSIHYDYTHRYMYFARVQRDDILRFRYPSEQDYNYETVILTPDPISVAVDSVHNHVYWTEIYAGKLYRCNVDGSNKQLVLQEDQLYALILDQKNRWLYYSTDGASRAIKRSRFNGTDIQTLVQTHPEYVYGLSIDYNEDRLYWMEHISGL